VLDVVYGGAPVTQASLDAIGQIEAERMPDNSSDAATREQWSIDQCIAGHWHLARGENAKGQQRAADLANLAGRHTSELWSDGAATCAHLLATWTALNEHKSTAPAMINDLDGELSGGAYMVSRLMWDITVISSARLFERAGKMASAENAARRRNWFYRWPHYLAAQLDELGRIADLRGDSTTAAEAYSHYVRLRDKPDSVLRPEVARIRARLMRRSGSEGAQVETRAPSELARG
jgi:hypothetical protein